MPALLALLLDASPGTTIVAQVLSLVVPLACLALVLAWWVFSIRRHGGIR